MMFRNETGGLEQNDPVEKMTVSSDGVDIFGGINLIVLSGFCFSKPVILENQETKRAYAYFKLWLGEMAGREVNEGRKNIVNISCKKPEVIETIRSSVKEGSNIIVKGYLRTRYSGEDINLRKTTEVDIYFLKSVDNF